MVADQKELLDLYRTMLTIRLFEEQVRTEFMQGKIPGMLHLYIGQEAVAAGVFGHLNKDDLITSHHRGHGHFIAKGADLKRMMAELYGKATGYCKGKGGSMHIADLELGNLGANGIVGGGLTIATGAAIAIQIKNEKEKVVVCFFGDGALSMGEFHESLNVAALWKLPIVYVCENNFYAMSNPLKDSCSVRDIAKRAEGYGMPGRTVDGMDVLAVYEASGQAIDRARTGGGPTLLVFDTYRFYGHGRNPDTRAYRTKEEEAEWIARCPLKTYEKFLLAEGEATEQQLAQLRADILAEVEQAVKFAEESPFPSVAEMEEDIYA